MIILHSGFVCMMRFLVVTLTLLPIVAATELEPVYLTDPGFPQPGPGAGVSPHRLRLWLAALSRPERELRIKAAESISAALQNGEAWPAEIVPLLIANIQSSRESDTMVRLAMARALVAADHRESAGLLQRLSVSDGLPVAEVVEPALARWNHPPMREVWAFRLGEPATSLRRMVLAIRGAALTDLQESIPRLRSLVRDRSVSAVLRVEAARALAVLQTQGLESDAAELLQRPAEQPPTDRLVAATILSRHAGRAATALLVQLAGHHEPAVAAIALERLLETSPGDAVPLNSELAAHRDPKIRKLSARLLQQQQTESAVLLLERLMNDRHPLVRRAAGEALIALDTAESLRAQVRKAATSQLESDQPVGQEQAAIVIGSIDHEPAAEKMVALLDSPHGRVRVAAAWALRRLMVADTVAPMLQQLRSETASSQIPLPLETPVDRAAVQNLHRQLGHLIEALGLMRVQDAVPVLLQYLPVPPQLPEKPVEVRLDTVWVKELRLQAIWALGMIHEGDPAADVVSHLKAKLSDSDGDQIRGMAAVSLGRMQCDEVVSVLRRAYASGDLYDDFRFGCAWAVQRLTGEPLPNFLPPPGLRRTTPSFLEPISEPGMDTSPNQ